MMLEPSIDKLLKNINSKYTLVTLSARRARQMQDTQKYLIEDYESEKYVGIALEEINEGKLYYSNDDY
ncbi:DNA-directed RNA polymerase subunit omega [Pontibacillus yanchengensis]|uniref:DNA-directed RNA polymerase subunit omega n=2 Tax=Pontibacillus yanchengensis TaxID=462910 RepID=A0ACC7VA25_9BACI|nr:DNA-directed RNA polymerase subunit omega [Pontibacillus yanchengensis]MYL33087.1 DNA-directed RNA polymerase subunit omega [Pontibacillus yanchengensis]MYL52063.1 DNA-directed RNA polymerase subunit omega [Pontibacillus yanchengensis]